MTDQQPTFQPTERPRPGAIERADFMRLTPADRARAIREGWTIVDDPAEPKPVTISRAQFDKLPPAGRAEFERRGGRVAG